MCINLEIIHIIQSIYLHVHLKHKDVSCRCMLLFQSVILKFRLNCDLLKPKVIFKITMDCINTVKRYYTSVYSIILLE